MTARQALAAAVILVAIGTGGGGRAEAPITAEAGEAALARRELALPAGHRSYYLAAPPPAVADRRRAAVFVFHGGLGDGLTAARMSGLAEAARRRGFLAVFPNGGRNGSEPWNDGRPTTHSDKDDVAFILALIDRLRDEHALEPRRVFAVGASSGGMFVYRLACEATARFAAFAAVIANLPSALAERCRPAGRAPMLIINGTADPLMPWAGGEIRGGGWLAPGRGGAVIATSDTFAFWRSVNGCGEDVLATPLPAPVADGTTVLRQEAMGCAADGAAVLYAVIGGGHGWPGGPAPRRGWLAGWLTGTNSGNLDATEVVLAFFERFGLNSR